ncbi:MAG: MaoC family dehydratase [Thalassobaculum sp.]|uniref:MaoC family dehydratase n=1 Tax=Thalassobaculum sp. TaxID=2022740 RepID=UPI0032F0359C
MTAVVSRIAFEDLRVGQQAAFEVEVPAADIDGFAALSGDVSPLHMDAGFARSRGFDGRVVHGAYLTALVSRLVGVHLPGENALLQSVAMQFRRPVPVGARLSVTGTVDQLSEAVRSAIVKVAIRNLADGETVATGKATVGFTGPAADG